MQEVLSEKRDDVEGLSVCPCHGGCEGGKQPINEVYRWSLIGRGSQCCSGREKYTKRQRRTMWPGNSARFSEEGIELPSTDREGRGQRKVDKIIPEAQVRKRRQEL